MQQAGVALADGQLAQPGVRDPREGSRQDHQRLFSRHPAYTFLPDAQ
jgi:hypothetical protein